jgi:pyridoxal biosynthesis lyase PdxS
VEAARRRNAGAEVVRGSGLTGAGDVVELAFDR